MSSMSIDTSDSIALNKMINYLDELT